MESLISQQALERAIANDELLLFYQPKVSLLTGQVIGAEALVRWSDAEGQIVSPNAFIPLAESSGLLHDLTIRLLDQLVDAAVELKQHSSGLALSINVAPNDLQSHAISNHIKGFIDQGIIAADDLQIEVTESIVMDNFDLIQDDIVRLTDLGIKVLMDDFGTGYSSIDRLSQLPFSALKLDQGVVKRMGTSRQNLNVVKSSISMARELRMTSIAEGIESAAVYNFLMANGCEEAQGFFISKPIALNEFFAFASQQHGFEGSQIGRIHQTVLNVLYQRKCLFDMLFCDSYDAQGSLPSVLDPDINAMLEKSRIGIWYFGVGQQLSGLQAFDSLEGPIRAMHKLSQELVDADLSSLSVSQRRNYLQGMDGQVNNIVTLLHTLESTLLVKTIESDI
jgi:EAL domain-containing protein (putative c-di-GMP-specific phosphodiesterase class I)